MKRRPWSLTGVIVGSAAYAASLSPSLLPRTTPTAVGLAVAGAVGGYALGSIVEGSAAALRRLSRHQGAGSGVTVPVADVSLARRITKPAVAVAAAAIAASLTPAALAEQDGQFALTGATGQPPASVVLVGATVVGTVALVYVGRGLRRGAQDLAEVMGRHWDGPYPARALVGGLVVAAGVGALGVAGYGATQQAFQRINNAVPDGQVQPDSPLRSGSPSSLVPWDTLGVEGRWFVQGGPSLADITAVTQSPAQAPIRAYTGVESAPTAAERARLAVADLVRAGGLERSAIIAYTTSTNGLVDPVAATAAEFLLGGDVASVSMQYTVLPSFVSFALSADSARDAGIELLKALREVVDELPEQQRPQIYLYGESLGAYGSAAPFAGTAVRDFGQLADGALWVGPPSSTEYWQELSSRAESGPAWAPVVDDGTIVRFVAEPSDLDDSAMPWPGPRAVFLQNATDPVVWLDGAVAWKRPAWLDTPRGPSVDTAMRWMPVVTFLQVFFDLPPAGDMPPGIGHNYSTDILECWSAVLRISPDPELRPALEAAVAEHSQN